MSSRPLRRPGPVAALLVAALLAGVGLLLAGPARAQPTGGGGVTFGVQPASVTKGEARPDSRPYLYYSVTPGATVSDHVAVLNYSTKPLVLNTYATDAVNTENGGFGLRPAADKPKDVGAWVQLGDGRPSYRVPARGVDAKGRQQVGLVVLPITVRVPASASPGDHAGGIVAALDTIAQNQQGARVRLDQRVGTRLFLRVAGPLHPALRVDHLKVTYHGTAAPLGDGSATVSYVVRNTGNVKLGAHQKLALSGWFGRTGRAPKLADVPLLLPGGSVPVRVEVPGVAPQFRLTAKVTLYPLRLPGDVDPELPAASSSARTWAIPWTAVGVGLLILLLAAGLWLWRRRLARRPAGRHGTAARDRTPTADKDEPMHVASFRQLAAVALAAATLAIGIPAAAADAIPFDDPNAIGTIGFCDRAGHEVTSGRIGDAPFAWTAVSSAPAPSGYGRGRGKATLAVYQPIKYVDPGDWSGKQLTAASAFTSTAHPMAQATPVDPALVDFVSVFPPHWDGLVQVRMIFTAPDQPQITDRYPAAVVRVQGDTWTLVSGGHPACRAGTAVSAETVALPSSVVSPEVARSTAAAGRAAGGTSHSPAPGRPSTGHPSAPGEEPTGSTHGVAATGPDDGAAHRSGGGGDSGWWVVPVLVAAAAASGAGVWRWRRRSATS